MASPSHVLDYYSAHRVTCKAVEGKPELTNYHIWHIRQKFVANCPQDRNIQCQKDKPPFRTTNLLDVYVCQVTKP
ncbi:uncharacterized protein G6M90_00g091210 [Metarhizium brunneum]|uniref:Uncharacterized protein n=1 Tax=Metarhizium brunneum TaxID=500148 RepID=A0A7D5V2H3_9HYPO|nr:hypothetical protein G6M90_00g091210 [Metarhizium brunneum]